jgi:hypothetical protein
MALMFDVRSIVYASATSGNVVINVVMCAKRNCPSYRDFRISDVSLYFIHSYIFRVVSNVYQFAYHYFAVCKTLHNTQTVQSFYRFENWKYMYALGRLFTLVRNKKDES